MVRALGELSGSETLAKVVFAYPSPSRSAGGSVRVWAAPPSELIRFGNQDDSALAAVELIRLGN